MISQMKLLVALHPYMGNLDYVYNYTKLRHVVRNYAITVPASQFNEAVEKSLVEFCILVVEACSNKETDDEARNNANAWADNICRNFSRHRNPDEPFVIDSMFNPPRAPVEFRGLITEYVPSFLYNTLWPFFFAPKYTEDGTFATWVNKTLWMNWDVFNRLVKAFPQAPINAWYTLLEEIGFHSTETVDGMIVALETFKNERFMVDAIISQYEYQRDQRPGITERWVYPTGDDARVVKWTYPESDLTRRTRDFSDLSINFQRKMRFGK